MKGGCELRQICLTCYWANLYTRSGCRKGNVMAKCSIMDLVDFVDHRCTIGRWQMSASCLSCSINKGCESARRYNMRCWRRSKAKGEGEAKGADEG